MSNADALRNIVLARGAGSLWDNLQNVLDALWQTAADMKVERSKFEPHLLRLRKHFLELEKLECIQLVYLKDRGAALTRIVLLKREVSQFSTPQKNAAVIIRKSVAMSPPKPALKQPGEVVPPSQCLLFIDVPNICFYLKSDKMAGGFQEPFLNFYRADWNALRMIVCTLTGVPMERQACHMYARTLNGGAEKFDNRCKEIHRSGIYLTTRDKKDVDEMLTVDLVLEMVPYLKKDQHVHLMLVSGDSDYAYALKRIRKAACDRQAKVTLHVMSWRHTQSPELMELVYKNAHFIDGYLRQIDPLGASLLTEYRQKQETSAC